MDADSKTFIIKLVEAQVNQIWVDEVCSSSPKS